MNNSLINTSLVTTYWCTNDVLTETSRVIQKVNVVLADIIRNKYGLKLFVYELKVTLFCVCILYVRGFEKEYSLLYQASSKS